VTRAACRHASARAAARRLVFPGLRAEQRQGFQFDKHRFPPGEYVSLKEHDGHMRTFRIVSVIDLEAESCGKPDDRWFGCALRRHLSLSQNSTKLHTGRNIQ
jgi:hypothetical protein